MKKDEVILVNDNDVQVGVMDKLEAHRNPAKLHRATSVYLFNDAGQLLIQQRGEQKIVGALQWANTCCGNVWPNETYEACAYRRLDHELGITDVALAPVYKFQYSIVCNDEYGENEMDQVFIGSYNGEVKPHEDEVADYEWVSLQKLIENKVDKDWAPWFELMMNDKKLINQIRSYL